jgi:eukaryotic-like serine/threonine-protein kinase
MILGDPDTSGEPERPKRSAETTPHQGSFEQLAAEFIDRIRAGESPTIDEYAERYPEMGAAVRELFPTVAAMEGLRLHKEQRREESEHDQELVVERLGDFRLLRVIGRGGMGVVYEAVQESLDRRVAVKVLRAQLLSEPKQLKRFEREAQTAAKLHHTNIVPVFGVGSQNGYHYYVMQLIEGVGLDDCSFVTPQVHPAERPRIGGAPIHRSTRTTRLPRHSVLA